MSARLHLITVEFPPSTWGGIATAVFLMAKAMELCREKYLVTTLASRSQLPKLRDMLSVCRVPYGDETDNSHPVYSGPRTPDALAALSSAIWTELRERLQSHDAVIINSEELGDIVTAVKRHTARVAYFCHGLHKAEHPSQPHLHEMQEAMVSTVDVVLVASRAFASEVRATFPKADVRVIDLPLHLLVPTRRLTTRTLGSRSPAVLSAGRAVEQKGFDRLIRALAHIQRVRGAASTTVVLGHGDETYTSKCKILASDLGIAQLEFVPWMERDLLLRTLSASQLLVVPSRHEPLGLIAAEAMALEVPVVASAVGGLVELLEGGRAGVLVTPEEEQEGLAEPLAKAIMKMLGDDALRQRYAAAGYRRIRGMSSVAFIRAIRDALNLSW